MKITLTAELISKMRAIFQQEVRDAENRIRGSVLSSMDDIRANVDRLEAARANLNIIKALQPGQVADFSASSGQLTPTNTIDSRPEGWRDGWAYVVRSRSGGPDHQITVGYKNGDITGSSCSCKAYKFGERCWALKAVMPPNAKLPSRIGIESVGAQRVDYLTDSFGLMGTDE